MSRSRPLWCQVPEWAQYLTRDRSCLWMWWKTKPFMNGFGNWISGGLSKVALANSEKPILEQRPGDSEAAA